MFTMVLEKVVAPLVRRWQERGSGLLVGDCHMPVLAFADDFYLLGRSKHDVQFMVQDFVQALQAHSMALQPVTCVWMAVQYDIGDEELRAGRGDIIPSAESMLALGACVDVGPCGTHCAHFCA